MGQVPFFSVRKSPFSRAMRVHCYRMLQLLHLSDQPASCWLAEQQYYWNFRLRAAWSTLTDMDNSTRFWPLVFLWSTSYDHRSGNFFGFEFQEIFEKATCHDSKTMPLQLQIFFFNLRRLRQRWSCIRTSSESADSSFSMSETMSGLSEITGYQTHVWDTAGTESAMSQTPQKPCQLSLKQRSLKQFIAKVFATFQGTRFKENLYYDHINLLNRTWP